MRIDSIEACAREDAYMVTIETAEEIEELVMAANNISMSWLTTFISN